MSDGFGHTTNQLPSPRLSLMITFRVYSGHGRLCVCLSLAAFPHYCMDPDVTGGMVGGALYFLHYRTDLQSVYGFRCCDNIAPNGKCQRVLVLALCLVRFSVSVATGAHIILTLDTLYYALYYAVVYYNLLSNKINRLRI